MQGDSPPTRLARLPLVVVAGVDAYLAVDRRARLLGLAHLERELAAPLLIPRCRSVHTFGMRFALDLHFLDRDGGVVDSRPAVRPRRFASCARAQAVLELPAGEGGEFSAGRP